MMALNCETVRDRLPDVLAGAVVGPEAQAGVQGAVLGAGATVLPPIFFTPGVPQRLTCYLKAATATEVGPVADMLSSVDRPTSHRRTGWNNEAWLSRTGDRQPSGAMPDCTPRHK